MANRSPTSLPLVPSRPGRLVEATVGEVTMLAPNVFPGRVRGAGGQISHAGALPHHLLLLLLQHQIPGSPFAHDPHPEELQALLPPLELALLHGRETLRARILAHPLSLDLLSLPLFLGSFGPIIIDRQRDPKGNRGRRRQSLLLPKKTDKLTINFFSVPVGIYRISSTKVPGIFDVITTEIALTVDDGLAQPEVRSRVR